MVGSIINGALKLGSSIFGGISASKAAKRAKKLVEEQKQKNQDWYNRRYNEDATQRADAQRILNKTTEAIKNRNKSIAGRSAVMGGDDASIAQEKALNAQAMADATSSIVTLGEGRKDIIENQYLTTDANLTNKLVDIENNRANAIADATKGVAGASGDIQSVIETINSQKDEQ